MELRCRVCKSKPWDGKHGNTARNVNKPGALHTHSLRLDFFALLFVSRQKVEEEKRNIPQLLLGEDIRQINLL